MSQITSSSVTISWNQPSDNGGLSLSSYIIERRDVRYSSWLRVDKVDPSIMSYCVQNLLEANEYLFRVFAENDEGPSEALQTSVPVLVEGVKGLE